MYSSFSESEERIAERKARILAGYKPEPTNRELIERITANLNECIAMMNAANDMQTRDAGALRALQIFQDNAEVIPDKAKVEITKRLNSTLELAGVKIDGTQPARQPATPAQLIARAWAAWAAFIVVLIALAVMVIR